MIQLPLELPKIEPGRKEKFIKSLLGGEAEEFKEFTEHTDIIDIGVGENPRALKRFINLLAFTVRLAETIKENIIHDRVETKETDEHKELLKEYFIPLLYIKWTIIVFRFHKVYSDIKGNWRRLIELQKATRDVEEAGGTEGVTEGQKGLQVDERLKKVLVKEPLFPEDEWLINRFIHLTESTVISEKERGVSLGYRQTFQPGDMVCIPKGKFLYGDEKIEEAIENDYYIDAFPVTNRQYKEFIDETDDGVPYVKEDWTKPYNWNKEAKTYPEGLEDHPVVLVSYHDAEAFCKWRSKKEGKEFRLPTEKEWEKAARGTDGREYPWGNDADFTKLNCADFHLKKVIKDYDQWEKEFNKGFYEENKGRALTSKVGQFENGASPYGCQDMAGNVWEWTESWYEGNKTKVLRGGSWSYNLNNARCAFRYGLNPEIRSFNIGFRCVRTLK